jgi:hypothetical protein
MVCNQLIKWIPLEELPKRSRRYDGFSMADFRVGWIHLDPQRDRDHDAKAWFSAAPPLEG